jgi:hypothetical protein
MTRSLALALSLASLAGFAGCSTHEANAQPTARPHTVADARAVCVDMFTRARTCTADYIPALVDARARHDAPPGIADAVKQDRAAVIAEAMKEWEVDSTDAAIGGLCDQISPQLVADEQGAIDTARGCLAQTECGAYTTCVMPLFEKNFAK